MSLETSSLNDEKELKARLEECEQDLLFWLHYYSVLAKRGKNMKVVAEKEIRRLEEEIKELYERLRG